MRRKYITTEDAAKRWGVTPQRVVRLCQQGRIDGALPPSGWRIPEDAEDPRQGTGRPRVSEPVRRRQYHDQEQIQDKTRQDPDSSIPQAEKPKHSDSPSPLDAIRMKYQQPETE